MEQIRARLKEEGIASLYSGAVAQAVATAVRSDVFLLFHASSLFSGSWHDDGRRHITLYTPLSTHHLSRFGLGRPLALLSHLQLPERPHSRAARRGSPAAPRPQRFPRRVEKSNRCSQLSSV